MAQVKGSKALVFEEGNLSKWLYTILKDKVDKLVVCDPSFVNRGESSLRKYYDDQLKKEMDHRAAKKNVARKIAAIALSVMRKGTCYRENYEGKKKDLNLQTV